MISGRITLVLDVIGMHVRYCINENIPMMCPAFVEQHLGSTPNTIDVIYSTRRFEGAVSFLLTRCGDNHIRWQRNTRAGRRDIYYSFYTGMRLEVERLLPDGGVLWVKIEEHKNGNS